MSVQFLSQGYSVIINIISETVIAFFLTITDEKELLFILGIIASLFVKFVINNASPKNTGSTTTTIQSKKSYLSDKALIDFLNALLMLTVFFTLNVLSQIIKDAAASSTVAWYELITLVIVLVAISFTIILRIGYINTIK